MKIVVIGYSGAGKSTLARELGLRFVCEVLHLDSINFISGWRERDRKEALALVSAFMARDSWIIDGNYSGFLQEQRLEEADQILFLDFSRWDCLRRVWKRYRTYRGRTREELPEGCVEKLDREFLRWVLWEGRTPRKREDYRRILERYPGKTVVLRNQRDIDRYLEVLPC
ncbi:MAG: DNA topology modulation protein [Clostridiales bacterium]|nr:DNA topology modulation protein [Clostridiales bacterium]